MLCCQDDICTNFRSERKKKNRVLDVERSGNLSGAGISLLSITAKAALWSHKAVVPFLFVRFRTTLTKSVSTSSRVPVDYPDHHICKYDLDPLMERSRGQDASKTPKTSREEIVTE
jgi:hypothetical protein